MKLPAELKRAAQAALDKKAEDVVALDIAKTSSFADYFLLATAQNPRQVAAIAEAVETALREHGLRPRHVEGYSRAEWVLLDYGDFVVHVFTARNRAFYDLERLWGEAARTEIAG